MLLLVRVVRSPLGTTNKKFLPFLAEASVFNPREVEWERVGKREFFVGGEQFGETLRTVGSQKNH